MQCTCNAHANLIHPHVHCISALPSARAMLRAEELASLRSLAERLAVQLQRAGPAPGVAKIMAAILIARDGHGARAACRLIPGVPDEGAHTFVGTLARRVGTLLSGAAIVEAAEVMETVAMDTSAAGSVVACSSIVQLESAAVCSSAAGLLAASSRLHRSRGIVGRAADSHHLLFHHHLHHGHCFHSHCFHRQHLHCR